MANTNLLPLGSTTKCTLKFNDISYIPIHAKMTAKLFSLLADQEKQNKIRKWMATAGIKLIHYNDARHIFKPSHEVLIDAFWYILNKVVNTKEEYQLAFYKNLILNVQKSKDKNLEEVKSFIDIVSNYSHNHIKVLGFIDSIVDYVLSIGIPLTNTAPLTIGQCIEYAVADLAGQNEEYTQIWKDLLELGLMKDSDLRRWMTTKMFFHMSLTTDSGKTFLRYISKCG